MAATGGRRRKRRLGRESQRGCYTHSFVGALRLYLLLSICILTGCANIPDSYAPPVQRKLPAGVSQSTLGHFVEMGTPDSDMYIVRGVMESVEASTWRWAHKRAELRFFLDTTQGLNFNADLAMAEATMKETGPVTISVFVNDKLIDSIHYTQPGVKHVLKPVAAELLRAKGMNVVAIEADKVYVSPSDGVALGFILMRAGFTQ
jgi:hypothetical protein